MTFDERSAEEYLRRYPRLCSHIIAESLGYAIPLVAARILKDAKEGQPNHCEWIYSCYSSNPARAVESAIRSRHRHKGYMASYPQALAIVRHYLDSGESPTLASWF
jgi:hypothetical protein